MLSALKTQHGSQKKGGRKKGKRGGKKKREKQDLGHHSLSWRKISPFWLCAPQKQNKKKKKKGKKGEKRYELWTWIAAYVVLWYHVWTSRGRRGGEGKGGSQPLTSYQVSITTAWMPRRVKKMGEEREKKGGKGGGVMALIDVSLNFNNDLIAYPRGGEKGEKPALMSKFYITIPHISYSG